MSGFVVADAIELFVVVKIQVYLDGVTGDRLVALAGLESRSVSSMARLLLERSLAPGEPLKPRVPPTVAVEQAVAAVKSATGKCLAYTPRGTVCKVCGKTH